MDSLLAYGSDESSADEEEKQDVPSAAGRAAKRACMPAPLQPSVAHGARAPCGTLYDITTSSSSSSRRQRNTQREDQELSARRGQLSESRLYSHYCMTQRLYFGFVYIYIFSATKRTRPVQDR